jgi:pimeloyl-ACP methyl ester carboxylesterase
MASEFRSAALDHCAANSHKSIDPTDLTSMRTITRTVTASALALALAACTPAPPAGARNADRTGEASMTVPHEPRSAMQARREGSGAPLALIGGGLTGWASWEPHQQRLSRTREVARLQPLSVQYGLEDRALPAGYSVQLEAAALAAALDRLGWREPLDLVAWSFGALVTLHFALDNPERVRTLTMIEPPAIWVLAGGEPEVADVRGLEPLLRSLRGDITEEQLERWARAVGLIPPNTDARTLPQWTRWVEHRRSLRNSWLPLDHEDDLHRLDVFHRPVLLVTGTDTPPWLRRITEVLAERLPQARVTEMPAGHAPQLVSMDRFLEELATFHRAAH